MTIRLREGDVEYLNAVFPTVGYNKPIRELVSKFVDTHREHAARQMAISTDVDIDIDI